MVPPPLPRLNQQEILALLSDDDDDLDELDISDDSGGEDEVAPPDTVEVMGEHGDMVVLPLEELEDFVIPCAPFVISEPHDEMAARTSQSPMAARTPPSPGSERITLTPPPYENIPFIPSPGSQEGLFIFLSVFTFVFNVS